MKNKLIGSMIALTVFMGGAGVASAAFTPSQVAERMDGVFAKIDSFISRLETLSQKLNARGVDVSQVNAAIIDLKAKHDTAVNEMQQFRAAFEASGDKMTAEVRTQGVEAKQALVDFLQAARDVHAKAKTAVENHMNQ